MELPRFLPLVVWPLCAVSGRPSQDTAGFDPGSLSSPQRHSPLARLLRWLPGKIAFDRLDEIVANQAEHKQVIGVGPPRPSCADPRTRPAIAVQSHSFGVACQPGASEHRRLKLRFACDSPLEQRGFELPVPP